MWSILAQVWLTCCPGCAQRPLDQLFSSQTSLPERCFLLVQHQSQTKSIHSSQDFGLTSSSFDIKGNWRNWPTVSHNMYSCQAPFQPRGKESNVSADSLNTRLTDGWHLLTISITFGTVKSAFSLMGYIQAPLVADCTTVTIKELVKTGLTLFQYYDLFLTITVCFLMPT